MTAAAGDGPTDPTVEEWLGYFTELSNWGRWGDDDTLGPLNLITPEVRRAAVALVTEGIQVSCARDVGWVGPTEDHGRPLHFMQRTGTAARATGADGASDWVVLPMHGLVMTHLDAPSHMFWDGQMYNGQPASQVTAERGARLGSLAPVADGIVGRGVLLDVAAAHGVEHLEPGYAITPADLDAAAERQHVDVRPGDVLMVRTGYGAARAAAVWPAGTGADPDDESLPHLPGLGPSCLPGCTPTTSRSSAPTPAPRPARRRTRSSPPSTSWRWSRWACGSSTGSSSRSSRGPASGSTARSSS
jgi:hypothetical protein